MSNLKELRVRIGSVKSTQKITSAMKLVAGAKLRRAQEKAEQALPYSQKLEQMLVNLAAGVDANENVSPLLTGTGKKDTYLLVIVSADRGLCGGFNAGLVRYARRYIQKLRKEGKTIRLIFLGKKASEVLYNTPGVQTIKTVTDLAKPDVNYEDAASIAASLEQLLADEDFDVCEVLYNRFESVLAQKPSVQTIIPLTLPNASTKEEADGVPDKNPQMQYLYEPSQAEILKTLLPKNLAVQIYKIMLENTAGEYAARMTAMDNATRNAKDMIKNLTLAYNKSRQAYITKELIEIISGAEALSG